MTNDLFRLFLANAVNSAKRMKDLRKSQLRIAYTILYHCELRINEIRHLTEKDIETAINAARFNVIHHKTKKTHIHVLSKKAIQGLRDCKLDMLVVFEKYNHKYFIDMRNKDLKSRLFKILQISLDIQILDLLCNIAGMLYLKLKFKTY